MTAVEREPRTALSPFPLLLELLTPFPPRFALCSNEHTQAGFQSQNIARSEFRIGSNGVCLLLAKMTESIESLIVEKGVVAWAKPDKSDGADNFDDGGGDFANPYYIETDGRSHSQSKVEAYLLRLIEGNVFTSVHEHLIVMVDVINRNGEVDNDDHAQLENDDKNNINACIDSVLTIIQLLMNSEKLTGSREGRNLLASIVSQLANGENDLASPAFKSQASGKSPSQSTGGRTAGENLVTSLKQLFSLVEDTSSKPQTHT
jgi:hypothetical protein